MNISVKLYTICTPDCSLDLFDLELNDLSQLRDILVPLCIKNKKNLIPMVNGKRRPWRYQLKSGDQIRIFPLIAGG